MLECLRFVGIGQCRPKAGQKLVRDYLCAVDGLMLGKHFVPAKGKKSNRSKDRDGADNEQRLPKEGWPSTLGGGSHGSVHFEPTIRLSSRALVMDL
jgi:hypothetical protein